MDGQVVEPNYYHLYRFTFLNKDTSTMTHTFNILNPPNPLTCDDVTALT